MFQKSSSCLRGSDDSVGAQVCTAFCAVIAALAECPSPATSADTIVDDSERAGARINCGQMPSGMDLVDDR